MSVIVLMFCGGLVGCGSETDTAAPTESAETADVSTTDEQTMSDDEVVDLLVSTAENSLGEFYYGYEYEDGMLTIKTICDGACLIALAGGGSEWDETTDAMDEASLTFKDAASACGSDMSVSVWLMNDENPDNVLYCTVDGVGIYDVTNE